MARSSRPAAATHLTAQQTPDLISAKHEDRANIDRHRLAAGDIVKEKMLDQADVPMAHGSDVAAHSTVSGAVSDAVTNGIAAGAALVSTGLHAVAEIAKTGIRGQEEVEPVKECEEEGAEKGEEANGEEPKEAEQEGLRLQFGSFDESLAENILADAPTGDSSFVSSLHHCFVHFVSSRTCSWASCAAAMTSW